MLVHPWLHRKSRYLVKFLIPYSDGIKIGALSIRGPARTQFSIMDMNLLHEMSSWAIGEIEMISQHRELELRESMQRARAKIGKLVESENDIEKGLGNTVVENV